MPPNVYVRVCIIYIYILYLVCIILCIYIYWIATFHWRAYVYTRSSRTKTNDAVTSGKHNQQRRSNTEIISGCFGRTWENQSLGWASPEAKHVKMKCKGPEYVSDLSNNGHVWSVASTGLVSSYNSHPTGQTNAETILGDTIPVHRNKLGNYHSQVRSVIFVWIAQWALVST